ncbi:OmpW/AlkL family protein [Desulfatibacillum aliphaticivorans]|uniref:OmpW/AlkL family protein n=1 Tax=Desulfatibacillum aliphaticivorans TaxID=218208 RepID=UPI0004128411|nr:porin family protein [Desulfatibacillum aliphaticivorans]
MKKIHWIVATAIVMAAFFSGPAMADDATGTWAIGLKAGYNNVLDDNKFESTGGDIDYVYDETAVFGVFGTYYFNKYCSLAFGLDYSEYSFTEETAGVSLDVGDIRQIPVYFTVRGHWANDSICTPYAGIGMGYYFNEFDQKVSAPSIELKNDFGFHAVGGVETRFTDSFGMDVELKYTDHSSEYEFDYGAITLHESTNLDAFAATLGFKYYFK